MNYLLPDALDWKHPGVSGITTRAGELTGWPVALGPEPTEAEQRQIVADYKAHLAQQRSEPDDAAVLAAVLQDKGLVTKAERDAKREELRQPVIELAS